MSHSWSEMLTFMTCQRKHELAYHDDLERIPSATNKARLYGTAFHAAMAENLLNAEKTINERIKLARIAAKNAIEDETVQFKTVRTPYGNDIPDQNYYEMINEIQDAIPSIIEFAIPQIDLNRYRVATLWEVFGYADCKECKGTGRFNNAGCLYCSGRGKSSFEDKTSLIEWDFDYDGFKGIIDAVLYNRLTDEYVLVDWKLRSMFPNDDAVAMDGQLAFYAAVLNKMGAKITQTIQWQFSRTVPKPSKLNQNGMPSIAAQATIFEYWWETLPSPLQSKLKRDEWENTMCDKLKHMSDFIRPIITHVTNTSSDLAYNNAKEVLNAIHHSNSRLELGFSAPAILGSMVCQYCDFFRLCSQPLKYGGDVSLILALEYQKRTRSDDNV